MMKGLIDRYVSHETVLGRLKEKLGAKETKMQELLVWKDVQIGKLDLTKQLLKESEAQVEALNKILKDKQTEISEAKSQLRHAKDVAIREQRDSNYLLRELDSSFAYGFDDCLHQVKASFPNLDLSHVNIDTQPQTPAQPVSSLGTEDLFTDNLVLGTLGDGETPPVNQAKPAGDEARPHEKDSTAEGKDGEDPVAQDQSFFFSFLLPFSIFLIYM